MAHHRNIQVIAMAAAKAKALLALSDWPAPIKAQNASTSTSGANRIAVRLRNYNLRGATNEHSLILRQCGQGRGCSVAGGCRWLRRRVAQRSARLVDRQGQD